MSVDQYFLLFPYLSEESRHASFIYSDGRTYNGSFFDSRVSYGCHDNQQYGNCVCCIIRDMVKEL